jgi:hypothetical protein
MSARSQLIVARPLLSLFGFSVVRSSDLYMATTQASNMAAGLDLRDRDRAWPDCLDPNAPHNMRRTRSALSSSSEPRR